MALVVLLQSKVQILIFPVFCSHTAEYFHFIEQQAEESNKAGWGKREEGDAGIIVEYFDILAASFFVKGLSWF